MQGRGLCLGKGQQVFPAFSLEERTVLDRNLHELRALGENSAGPERIVTHFAVADVVVARQADRGSVRRQSREESRIFQLRQGRRPSEGDGVAELRFAEADPVHYDAQDLVFDPCLRARHFAYPRKRADYPMACAPSKRFSHAVTDIADGQGARINKGKAIFSSNIFTLFRQTFRFERRMKI